MLAMPSAHRFIRHASLPHLELRTAEGSSDCYQTHTHEEYAFGVVLSGRALFSHGSASTPLSAGMTVMMEPGLAHACNPDTQQSWSYRMLFVDAHWLHRSFLPFASGSSPQPLRLRKHSSQAMALFKALNRIADGLLAPQPDPLELDELLLDFIARHALVPRSDEPQDLTPTRGEPVGLAKVRALIDAQLESSLALEQLAALGGWSEFQLIRRFKQAYGQTPHAYQIDQRLNRAKKLLRQGLPLSEIAQQLGFVDQSHFQRHFKQRHATTPKHYQGSGTAQRRVR